MSFNYENLLNIETFKTGKPAVEKIAVEEIATPEEIAAMREYLRSFGESGADAVPEFFMPVYDAKIFDLPVSAAVETSGGEESLLNARIALVVYLMKEADAEMIAELKAHRAGYATEH